ncbi:hypothetical membrane protein, conserved [Thermococcus kodakarensis KOD1]|uniref:Hypothetical membrane protein, conserved n=1 Tax=Thermococcus kodakarensis (strain ATCC BAA-918 / JCM 12380 / KOD1) TaxID=69014 RepID=Q5JGU8_THEKO|nr:DUF2178 domain-containing protein [Thermococcus kodakarensis]WCN27320.1 DUF2178 domain-containing protein [Thermococcus kodakarensis]WCN29608.1 DUF2178 domain-containing protein [Thermococcus kodakarensis]BAD85529.1 hypothetical membrane protein, conserved [Thermococcus kodakarensis KOD1]
MLKYEELLVVLVTGIVIGLAYSVKSGKGLLAVGIFLLGILLTYALNWYYNSRVERIEDERTEMINARSTRNAYALMSPSSLPNTSGSTATGTLEQQLCSSSPWSWVHSCSLSPSTGTNG